MFNRSPQQSISPHPGEPWLRPAQTEEKPHITLFSADPGCAGSGMHSLCHSKRLLVHYFRKSPLRSNAAERTRFIWHRAKGVPLIVSWGHGGVRVSPTFGRSGLLGPFEKHLVSLSEATGNVVPAAWLPPSTGWTSALVNWSQGLVFKAGMYISTNLGKLNYNSSHPRAMTPLSNELFLKCYIIHTLLGCVA